MIISKKDVDTEMIDKKRKEIIGDYIISVAVLSQPSLMLLQHLLASVVGLELEQTTVYRVALTVALLVPAIIVSVFRKPAVFIITYIITSFFLLFTIVAFPKNEAILIEQSFRFLLPVVIPSFVCVLAIRDFGIIKHSLQYMGWIAAVGAVSFLAFFLMGRFSIDKYSMSFSYACLFPMLVLYTQKRPLPVLISFLIFFEVLAFGSRGAAVIYMVFMALDLFRQKGKMRALVIVGGILLLALFPFFVKYLDQIGVYSRSVSLLMNGGFTESDGRDVIYRLIISAINNNLFTGLGLYGDRANFGVYSHNIVLEIVLDFGIILGSIFLILFISIIIKALNISKYDVHEVAMVLLFCGILPNMLSGSYIQEPYFALSMGYCVWVLNHKEQARCILNKC